MKEQVVVHALRGLAHPLRLRSSRALVVSGPRGHTPGDMRKGWGAPGTTLAIRLEERASAGAVIVERCSPHLIYRAASGHTGCALKYLTEHCCEGAECTIASVSIHCEC